MRPLGSGRPLLGDPAIAKQRMTEIATHSLMEGGEIVVPPSETPPVQDAPIEQSEPEGETPEPPQPVADPAVVEELIAGVDQAAVFLSETHPELAPLLSEMVNAIQRLAGAVNNIGAMQEWQNMAIAETTKNINNLVNSGNPVAMISQMMGMGKKRGR